MLGVIFTIIAFYFLFRLIFGFVIPVLAATKEVRSKVKDMNQKMTDFESTGQTFNPSSNSTYPKNEPASSVAKGDYIDFEEIK
ncbi:MAG TPA: hypothetical protein VF540_05960 [Segetibacter sp.]|jgi:hypothetical protein